VGRHAAPRRQDARLGRNPPAAPSPSLLLDWPVPAQGLARVLLSHRIADHYFEFVTTAALFNSERICRRIAS
jgi:hypothetical protein